MDRKASSSRGMKILQLSLSAYSYKKKYDDDDKNEKKVEIGYVESETSKIRPI